MSTQWMKGVRYDAQAKRPELMLLARAHKPPKTYVCDSKAEEAGFKVIRLPPYHCHLNPI